MRRRWPPLVSLVTLVLLSACAALYPPIHTEPGESPSLELIAHRAAPDGLHLRLRAPQAAPGDQLQIWRQRQAGEWELLQTIDVQDQLVDPLHLGQAQWNDPLPNESAELTYRLLQIRQDQPLFSTSLTVEWTGWPEPPRCSTSTSATPPAVNLSCNEGRAAGMRILRRDVLLGGNFEPRSVVDGATNGLFHDSQVQSGGVYAYRIQKVDHEHPHFPRFSDFSDALYVALPE